MILSIWDSALERDEKKDKRPADPFYAIVEEITHESGGVVERKYLEKLHRLLDLARNNEMCFVALMVCPDCYLSKIPISHLAPP